jgi:hypothetical protein
VSPALNPARRRYVQTKTGIKPASGYLHTPAGLLPLLTTLDPIPPSTRGSLPIGLSNYAPPANAVYVDDSAASGGNGTIGAPYNSVPTAVTNCPDGGTIVFRAGEYQLNNYAGPTGKNMTWQAYPNEAVWFDGSKVVTPTASGSNWTVPLTTVFTRFDLATVDVTGNVGARYLDPNFPYAGYWEQLWIDGIALTQIDDGQTPALNQFSVLNRGAANQQILFNATVAGKQVRVSDKKMCFIANDTLNLYGIGVRRYSPDGNTQQSMDFPGAPVYYGGTSGGSTIENCYFQDSAKAGLVLAKPNITLQRLTVQDNGYQGIAGGKVDGLIVRQCIVQRNCWGRWKTAPSTGALKFTRADRLLIDDNLITGNFTGNGIWLDISVTRFQIVNNDVVGGNGGRVGCQVELSGGGLFSGVQFWGIVANNDIGGFTFGVTIFDSDHVKVWNNYVHDVSSAQFDIGFHQDNRMNRGPTSDTYQPATVVPWLTQHNEVCNNRTKNGTIQLIAYDDGATVRGTAPLLGSDICDIVDGNWFMPAPPGTMVQWGKADGSRTSYNTPSSFQSAVNGGWSNQQNSTAPNDSLAKPIPADVAQYIHQTAGVRHFGTFR